MRVFALGAVLAATLVLPYGATADDEVIRSHGYSYFGELKYPADYPHFDYVNPDAPKGGEISMAALGTFDSMNPYSRKGRAGAYSNVTAESLLGQALFVSEGMPADAYGEMYGLLAESLEYPKDKSWVIFHLRPEARFSNGDAVTAEDVVFTHDLFLEQGLPSYAQAVKKRIKSAEALDTHTVKFTFVDGISRRSLIDQVGATPVFSKKWFEETGARLDEPRMEPAMGTGPYILDSYDVNRRIVWKRNPDYWGWHLPINKGRHNFDRVRVEYFGDETAAFEAFKAGAYTFRSETNSRQWATGYDFPAVDQGWVKKESLPNGTPPTPSGFVFNLLRVPWQDIRVREALTLAYNFEWTNASLQYGLFKQRYGYSQGTEIEAKGTPEGAERAVFDALGDLVPEAILTEPALMAHSSNPKRVRDRKNLLAAGQLLEEAGWKVGNGRTRSNAAGEPLRLNFLGTTAGSATADAIIENYIGNLKGLGVEATYEKVDPAQYTLRERDKDYDMVMDSYAAFLEAGTGLRQRFGSEDAVISLFNPASLQSPLVDAVIDTALMTESREEEIAALTALDRVLRAERLMVPLHYTDSTWVAYFDQYDHPEVLPQFGEGILDFWWFDAEKAAALRAAGALR